MFRGLHNSDSSLFWFVDFRMPSTLRGPVKTFENTCAWGADKVIKDPIITFVHGNVLHRENPQSS